MTQDRRQVRRRWKRRGQSIVEFTFVGIPVIFILISIFEMSRAMWVYHTLAYSSKVGVRYASVHGEDCYPNGVSVCAQTISQIMQVIQNAGVGLEPSTTTVTFHTLDVSNSVKTAETVVCTLSGSCSTGSSSQIWPPNTGSNQKGSLIEIQVTTPFKTAMALFWPGSKPTSIAAVDLPASSRDVIQF